MKNGAAYIVLLVLAVFVAVAVYVSMNNQSVGRPDQTEYAYRVIVLDTLGASVKADTSYLQINGYYKNSGGHVLPKNRLQPVPVLKGERMPHDMLDSVLQSLLEVNPDCIVLVSEMVKAEKLIKNEGE